MQTLQSALRRTVALSYWISTRFRALRRQNAGRKRNLKKNNKSAVARCLGAGARWLREGNTIFDPSLGSGWGIGWNCPRNTAYHAEKGNHHAKAHRTRTRGIE